LEEEVKKNILQIKEKDLELGKRNEEVALMTTMERKFQEDLDRSNKKVRTLKKMVDAFMTTE